MGIRSEEVILEEHDEGWGKPMPVRLLVYSDGKMDIHRQTGPQFKVHIQKANEILQKRGLKINEKDEWMVGCTGAYREVVKL